MFFSFIGNIIYDVIAKVVILIRQITTCVFAYT